MRVAIGLVGKAERVVAGRVAPGFRLRDPRRQRTDLHRLPLSLPLLRQDQGGQAVLGKSFENLTARKMR